MQLGLPFSFAHHFAAHNTLAGVEVYRPAFRPSAELAEPYVMLGVPVICAPTRASGPAGWPVRAAVVRAAPSGPPTQLPTPEEAAEHVFTPMERELVRRGRDP